MCSDADFLRGYRKQNDLTQTELAESFGVDQGRISGVERGKRPVSLQMAARIADRRGHYQFMRRALERLLRPCAAVFGDGEIAATIERWIAGHKEERGDAEDPARDGICF